MGRTALIAGLLVLNLLAGCGKKQVDHESRFDGEVEERWTRNSKLVVDAIQHLARGGSYVDTGDPEDPVLDRPHILPLLQRLGKECDLEWQAVLEETNQTRAWAVIAKLPNDAALRKRIEAALAREEKTFPGAIVQQWGHQWLSLDFLTKEQAAFFDEEPAKKGP